MSIEDIIVGLLAVGVFAHFLRLMVNSYVGAMRELDREVEKAKIRKRGKDPGEFEA